VTARTAILAALIAALLFGASTPLAKLLVGDIAPILLAGLLYMGSGLGLWLLRLARDRRLSTPRLPAREWPWFLGAIAAGGVIGPVLLMYGLTRTSAANASLLLNLEAVFTIVLGALFYREHVGRRVAVAAAVMTAGGAVLLAGHDEGGPAGLWGLLAVGVATLGWALDNALSRPLSDLDPAAVVAAKGAIGATASLGLAAGAGEPWPAAGWATAALVLSGAVGYGASLRLYLLAQRRLGTGRTASVYAAAPFVGAAVARLAGQPLGRGALAGGALMAFGVYLHLTEQHEHEHRHDDGHHVHTHDPMPPGEHSHAHRHEPVSHAHAHAPDVHHRHGH
jgi:drug/metabolite transporter (DMT)-like permease